MASSSSIQIFSSSSATSSSSIFQWKYDVFLSFRGEDTRKNFIDDLYDALQRKGIYTFKDDEKLERGKSISPGLLKAIEESRFSIVVFSKNFAASSWCLDELVKILECKDTMGKTILPIFYDVDPSDVRKQRGSFEGHMAKHEELLKEEIEKVQRWRTALSEAASISGWDLRNVENGHKLRFIPKIVEDISRKLKRPSLHVADYPVGIDARMMELIKLLENGTNNVVLMVGICGIGGTGKTAVAKAVFNQIYDQFESGCFLANVREVSNQHGLAYLQEEILHEIIMERKMKISNIDRGIKVIKERLCNTRVLLVLDDVDQLEQLQSLAGKHDWFGSGSRIIITTRDEHLLAVHGVNSIYKAKLLNDNEALQLFSWHTFRERHPMKDYLELSHSVIDYAQGLPLALQILGSFLYDKRAVREWESALDKLRKIPNRKIQDVLQVSFDGLDDTDLKDIFLDIACFFKGYDKDYVIDLLESCGLHPRIGITVLVQRSLVTMSGNILWMHDLIQEMGKEIVRQESPKAPGKRSRLWFHEDIYKVLIENTVTEAIEGIVLNSPRPKELHVNADAFARMKKLRLLKLHDVILSGRLTYLSNELSYLDWDGYPLNSMPSHFHGEKLVELNLCHSQIKRFWKGIKILEKLKFLNLSQSPYLEKTPDFSGTPCLERLHLDGCTNLVEVHPSIGGHERLVEFTLTGCKNLRILPRSINLKSLKIFVLSSCTKLEKFPEIEGDMDGLGELLLDQTALKDLPASIEHLNGLRTLLLINCKKLKSIPSSISKMKSLHTLVLSGCSKLKKFPDIPTKMESLGILHLDGTRITQLPSSIVVNLNNLEVLTFGGFKGMSSKRPGSLALPFSQPKKIPVSTNLSSLSGLCTLRELNLSDCNLLEASIPNDLSGLLSLVYLDISRNSFVSIPESIIQLSQLQNLHLEYCTKLQALPTLPSSICRIDAHGCASLERFSVPPSIGIPDDRLFLFTDGHKLVENQTNNSTNILMESQLQELGQIALPGSEVPAWFIHQSNGSSISLQVDPHSCSKLKGIALCAVLVSDGVHWFPDRITCDLKVNDHHDTHDVWTSDPGKSEERHIVSDHVFLIHITRGKYERVKDWPNDNEGGYGASHRAGPVKNLTYLKSKQGSDTPLYDWAHIKASFRSSVSQVEVEKCGIHLLMEQDEKDHHILLKQ